MEHSLPAFRIDNRAVLVTLVCLAGAALSAVLLYHDLNDSGVGGSGTPMARVEKRISKVRRKPPTSFIWNNLGADAPLYRKEYVQTGPESSALIRLNDGAMLELKENSLIVIDETANLSLNFVRGGGVLRSQQGDSRITANEKGGQAKVEKLPIQLTSPDPLAEFATDSATRLIRFGWKILGVKPPDLELHVSTSPKFTSSTTRITPASSTGAESSLKPGEYFWRLGQGGQGLSEVGSFQVIAAPKIRPIFPINNQRIQSFGDESVVQFRWAYENLPNSSEPIKATLEVATDSQFRALVRSEPVLFASGSASIQKLASGIYFWRLRTKFREIEGASSAEPFGFSRTERLNLTLQSPEDSAAQPLKGPLSFNWFAEDAPADVTYQAEVSDDGGKILAQSPFGPIPRWTWAEPRHGALQWRVRAQWKGKSVGESTWRKFSLYADQPLVLRVPARGQKIHFWDSPPDMSFEWEKDPLVESQGFEYEVQVSPFQDFSKDVITQKTRSAKFEGIKPDTKLSPSGQFFWKVRVVRQNGQIAKSSDTGSFQYSIHPPPSPPSTAQLDEGITQINPLERPKWPKLNWAKVPEVSDYEVTLIQAAPEGKKVLLQKIVDSTELPLSQLPQGNYEYTIRSVDRLKRKGEAMAPKTFSVTFGEALPPPKTTSEIFQ